MLGQGVEPCDPNIEQCEPVCDPTKEECGPTQAELRGRDLGAFTFIMFL